MTEKNGSDGISRRSVLRTGAITAGAVSVGVAGFSGTAAASDCPRTPGFWANHDWCRLDSGEQSVWESLDGADDTLTCEDGTASGEYELFDTGVSKTMPEWQDFLVGPARGDKAIIMARTLLATKLNLQRREVDDPDCTDRVLDLSEYGLGEMTVIQVTGAARTWLENSSWDGRPQRSWTVDGTDGEPLKDVLDAFNNGTLPLDCDCDGES